MAPDNPIASLWEELANAEWVADNGLPLLATLAAIGLSFIFLRLQLRHQREAQVAMTTAEAARVFGLAVLDALDEVDNSDLTDPVLRQAEWPVWSKVLRAQGTAVRAIGQSDEMRDAIVVARSGLYVWRAAQRGYAKAKATVPGMTDDPCGLAVDAVMNPWANHLKSLATRYVRWDGHGSVPRADVGNLLHVPLPAPRFPEAHAKWMAHYERATIEKARGIHQRDQRRKARSR